MLTKPYSNKRPAGVKKDSQLGQLKNRRSALKWLREKGWRCGRGTLYRHVAEGRLQVQPDGTVDATALELYALTHLQKTAPPPDCKAVAGLLEVEKQAQIKLLKTREEKLRFETDLARGLYLERNAVLTEFCVKIAVFEAFMKTMARTHCDAWVAMVEGNRDRAGELYQAIEAGIDEALGDMGDMPEIRVKIKKNTEVPNP